jgi:hypothetical protein
LRRRERRLIAQWAERIGFHLPSTLWLLSISCLGSGDLIQGRCSAGAAGRSLASRESSRRIRRGSRTPCGASDVLRPRRDWLQAPRLMSQARRDARCCVSAKAGHTERIGVHRKFREEARSARKESKPSPGRHAIGVAEARSPGDGNPEARRALAASGWIRPAGDALVTRRAKAKSRRYTIVVRFGRT